MRVGTTLIAVAAVAGVAAAQDYASYLSSVYGNLVISTAGTVGPLYCPYSHIVADAIH